MSIRLRHILKPLEILWNRYTAFQASVDEKFSLKDYETKLLEVRNEIFNRIEQSIKKKKKRYSYWDCLEANAAFLQGSIVIFGVFLSLRNKDIPKYIFAKKKFTIGPKLFLMVSLVSILDAVGEAFKYISNYYRAKYDRLVSRRSDFHEINQKSLSKRVRQCEEHIKNLNQEIHSPKLTLKSSKHKNT